MKPLVTAALLAVSLLSVPPVSADVIEERAVGFQRWRELLFLHRPMPPGALRPFVAPALELDLFFEGTRERVDLTRLRARRAATRPSDLRALGY
jgi:hypothetical protein